MKRQSYISSKELLDLYKVGIMAGEFAAIAEKTPEKDWRTKLRIMATYCEHIMMERLLSLDYKQRLTVERRYKHTEIKFHTSDQYRMNKDKMNTEPSITLETEDLYDLVDLALLSCYKCPQGECVKDCRFRDIFHTIGVPPFRMEPKEGECEFRYDPIGEQRSVTPQYKLMKELGEEIKKVDLEND